MAKETPIKAARRKLNQTQAEVSKKIGVATNAYQQYEYGNATPNAKLAIRIARALDTTVEELWGTTDRRE